MAFEWCRVRRMVVGECWRVVVLVLAERWSILDLDAGMWEMELAVLTLLFSKVSQWCYYSLDLRDAVRRLLT